MWVYLNELLAYATYCYEYVLEVVFGNRYVVRFGKLKRIAPSGDELCVVETKGWKSFSSRLDRGDHTHPPVDNFNILDVSIEGCTDERISHFLTPLLGHMDNILRVYGWELCQLGSSVCGSKCTGRIEITYLDMSTDTFGMEDTILIRSECHTTTEQW